MIEGMLADGAAGVAKLLPVRHFVDDPGAFGASNAGRMADVLAELRVLEQFVGSSWKVSPWPVDLVRSGGVHCVESLDASIPAKCAVRTKVRWRCSEP